MPAPLGEFARHGAENAIPFRSHFLALFLNKHDRILIKANMRAVLAREWRGLADDDRAINIFFLHHLARLGGLHGNDDRIADARITAAGTAEHFEDPRDLAAGIICDQNDGPWLQHIIS